MSDNEKTIYILTELSKADKRIMFPRKDIIQALDMAIKALEKEPKTGHWITKDGKEQGYDIGGVKTWYIQIMCNECGFIKTAIEGHTGQYHYCPNCGAKMKESEEEDKIISETSMHHFACAFCDNEKCVRGTKECEFEQWKKKERKENEKSNN